MWGVKYSGNDISEKKKLLNSHDQRISKNCRGTCNVQRQSAHHAGETQ